MVKNSFKSIICFLLIAVLGVAFVQANEKPIRIGIITDIQYANKPDGKTRFYRSSIQKLEKAVQDLNQEELDLTLVLGDYVDEGPKDIGTVISHLKKLNNPFMGTLGNHDYPMDYDNKLLSRYSIPAFYYSFFLKDWKFIFLNTNELSSYAIYKEGKLKNEFKKLITEKKHANRENLHPWNGGISAKQMRWLKRELLDANKKDKKVLIFAHHPLFPENGLEALNNREILTLLTNYKRVKAVITGHYHEGNYAIFNDLHCLTLEGMVETYDKSAYGIIELFSDSLIIHGKGRMTSRIIKFR